jgi:hypothetical protein
MVLWLRVVLWSLAVLSSGALLLSAVRWPSTRRGMAVVLGGIAAAVLLVFYPEWEMGSFDGERGSRDYIELRNAIRATIAQVLGGILVAIGVVVTWRRVAAVERQVDVAREQQITERFTHGIEQLGSEKLEVRLGGIYALERIAQDSKKDLWTIMEVLTAFVRERSPRCALRPSEPDTLQDVQPANADASSDTRDSGHPHRPRATQCRERKRGPHSPRSARG